MAEIKFEGKGEALWNNGFISQFINPALNKLSDIQLYQERGGGNMAVELKAEKTNGPIARVDMKSLLEQLTNRTSEIVRINGEFYNLQEALNHSDNKWIIAQNYKPILRIDFSSTAHMQWVNMTSYDKDTSLEHYLDHMDSHKGKPWHISMKFNGPNQFIEKIYENLLNFYKKNKETKILV